jgi:hypothetical protein
MAACERGIVVFGPLMGAMLVGHQFVQNVLGYPTLDAGFAILPAGVRPGDRARRERVRVADQALPNPLPQPS